MTSEQLVEPGDREADTYIAEQLGWTNCKLMGTRASWVGLPPAWWDREASKMRCLDDGLAQDQSRLRDEVWEIPEFTTDYGWGLYLFALTLYMQSVTAVWCSDSKDGRLKDQHPINGRWLEWCITIGTNKWATGPYFAVTAARAFLSMGAKFSGKD